MTCFFSEHCNYLSLTSEGVLVFYSSCVGMEHCGKEGQPSLWVFFSIAWFLKLCC